MAVKEVYVGPAIYYGIEWIIGNQDIANNRTYITFRTYLRTTTGGDAYSNTRDGYTIIDGSRVNYTNNCNIGQNQKKILTTRNAWVNHTADGTKTVSMTGSFTMNITYAGVWKGTQTLQTSVTLPTIPRKSTVTIKDAYLPVGSIPYTIASSSSSFNHDLKLEVNGTQVWTGSSKGSGSVTVNDALQKRLVGLVPAGTNKPMRMTCTTKSGSTVTGTDTSSAKMYGTSFANANKPPVINLATSTSNSTYGLILSTPSGVTATRRLLIPSVGFEKPITANTFSISDDERDIILKHLSNDKDVPYYIETITYLSDVQSGIAKSPESTMRVVSPDVMITSATDEVVNGRPYKILVNVPRSGLNPSSELRWVFDVRYNNDSILLDDNVTTNDTEMMIEIPSDVVDSVLLTGDVGTKTLYVHYYLRNMVGNKLIPEGRQDLAVNSNITSPSSGSKIRSGSLGVQPQLLGYDSSTIIPPMSLLSTSKSPYFSNHLTGTVLPIDMMEYVGTDTILIDSYTYDETNTKVPLVPSPSTSVVYNTAMSKISKLCTSSEYYGEEVIGSSIKVLSDTSEYVGNSSTGSTILSGTLLSVVGSELTEYGTPILVVTGGRKVSANKSIVRVVDTYKYGTSGVLPPTVLMRLLPSDKKYKLGKIPITSEYSVTTNKYWTQLNIVGHAIVIADKSEGWYTSTDTTKASEKYPSDAKLSPMLVVSTSKVTTGDSSYVVEVKYKGVSKFILSTDIYNTDDYIKGSGSVLPSNSTTKRSFTDYFSFNEYDKPKVTITQNVSSDVSSTTRVQYSVVCKSIINPDSNKEININKLTRITLRKVGNEVLNEFNNAALSLNGSHIIPLSIDIDTRYLVDCTDSFLTSSSVMKFNKAIPLLFMDAKLNSVGMKGYPTKPDSSQIYNQS